MGLGWEEIDKNLDLGYIRVAGLHRECKPAVLFDPPNFGPRTMTHVCMYMFTIVCMYVCVMVRGQKLGGSKSTAGLHSRCSPATLM